MSCSFKSATTKPRRCGCRASTSTNGGRAKSDWSPAGIPDRRIGRSARRSDRRSVRTPESARGERRWMRSRPVHRLHRDLGIDLDRDPRPAGRRSPPQWSVTYRFVIAALAMFAIVANSAARTSPSAGAVSSPRPSSDSPSSASISTRSIWPSGTSRRAWSRRYSRLLLIPSTLLGWAFLGQRPSRRFVWSSLVAVAGIGLLFVHELQEHAASAQAIFVGIGYTLLGMVSALESPTSCRLAARFAICPCSACSPGRWPPAR